MDFNNANIQLNDILSKQDFTALTSQLHDYWLTSCESPRKISVRSRLLGLSGDIYVPCGHCFQCGFDKRTDLLSRVWLHLQQPNMHFYFVTLNLRSVSSHPIPKQAKHRPAEQLLFDIFPTLQWHYDTCNTSGQYKYSPSCIDVSIYQKFLKRLRKRLGDCILSYLFCTEYGKTYGRPHAHFLLFCDKEITYEDIVSCWSVEYVYNKKGYLKRVTNRKYLSSDAHPQRLLFDEHLDFQDCIANGTYSGTSSKSHNTKNCLSYVTKYLTKSGSYNKTRIHYAYGLHLSQNYLTDEECSFESYQRLHSPKVYKSSSHSLGKNYYLENFERFLQGNHALPTANAANHKVPLHYPSIFDSWDKKHIYPWRTTDPLRPCSPSRILTPEDLRLLCRNFSQRLRSHSHLSSCVGTHYTVYDVSKGIKYIPSHDFNFAAYKFNRSLRCYEYLFSIGFADLLRVVSADHRAYKKRYQDSAERSFINHQTFDTLINQIPNYDKEHDDFIKSKRERLAAADALYHLDHSVFACE